MQQQHNSNSINTTNINHLFSVCYLSIAVICILLLSPATAVAAGGKVESLQMPAWLERNNQLIAISPGLELMSGDKISTGDNARLLLHMDEGSLLKLGSNAELVFNSLMPAEEEGGFFEATLNVLKGSFRFTTTALSSTYKRQLKFQIGSVTAGIRGTDIWGSSSNDKDMLCLIEGQITAHRQGEPEFTMRNALTLYLVPKNQSALPVSAVTEEKLALWAEETELVRASGILSQAGQWRLNLISVTNESSVTSIKAKLNSAGYAADIQTAVVHGKDWYRLGISGFNSRQEANAIAASIEGLYGISGAWSNKIQEQ